MISGQNKKCIISFANERGRYKESLSRLEESLKGNYDGDFLGFIGEESVGSPKHLDNPYAFKVYCWLKAIEQGYTQILWIDSSCFAIKNLNPVFDVINKEGYIMQEAGHLVGTWTNDKTLEYFGITREQAMTMPMYGNAGFLGLNIKKQPAMDFFFRWWDSMLGGCFKGSWDDHRHDMSCGSIIANQLGMKFKPGDEWLQYAGPEDKAINDKISIFAQGM